ncbi:MAG: SRPBCC domain-containing protein [Spirochaetia bacterium]|nr:SRPBCC domain-containing protein [Spirochaetia bacterium]
MKLDDMTLDIEQHIEVEGPIAEVFKSTLYRFGEGNKGPDGQSLEMKLEEFAGGRWFRDRANGAQHFWGHVQVLKAPVLLEISGPMFMSYPAINHLEIRLEETAGVTKVTLRHRAIGMIDPQHRTGLKHGWGLMLDAVKADFSKSAARA